MTRRERIEAVVTRTADAIADTLRLKPSQRPGLTLILRSMVEEIDGIPQRRPLFGKARVGAPQEAPNPEGSPR